MSQAVQAGGQWVSLTVCRVRHTHTATQFSPILHCWQGGTSAASSEARQPQAVTWEMCVILTHMRS